MDDNKTKNKNGRRIIMLFIAAAVLIAVNTIKIKDTLQDKFGIDITKPITELFGKGTVAKNEPTGKKVDTTAAGKTGEDLKKAEEDKALAASKAAEEEKLAEEAKKKAEEEKLAEEEKKKEEAAKLAQNGMFSFTKNANVKVYSEPKTGLKDTVDTLISNVRVRVLEKKDEIISKEKKVKGKDGKTAVVKEDTVSKWQKISYRKNQKNMIGWILEGNLANDRTELLPASWKGLDFGRIEKNEFPTNKKIKVRGIYVSAASAGLTSRLNNLIALTKRTPINAFVIDVKDDSGYLLFNMAIGDKYSTNSNKYNQIKDIAAFMKKLKDNNIYAIARIVSFKDPTYAKTHPDRTILDLSTGKAYVNRDGVIWVSPYDRELWAYNIGVAKEAARVGFNEIQFDYVRFPATGGEKADKHINYRNAKNESKPVAIQNYLKYARKELEPLNVYISADVYGQIGSMVDDMSIGQYWESISNATDYISPMVYPSHYTKGVYGLPVPDAQPYNTVYRCVRDEINRNENLDTPAAIRPWIQAFTAKWVKGYINYGYEQVQAEIQALDDLGIKEYILWNPSNRYWMAEKNPPKEAVEPEKAAPKKEATKQAPKKASPAKTTTPAKPVAKPAPAKPAPTKPVAAPKKENAPKTTNNTKKNAKLIDRFEKVTN